MPKKSLPRQPSGPTAAASVPPVEAGSVSVTSPALRLFHLNLLSHAGISTTRCKHGCLEYASNAERATYRDASRTVGDLMMDTRAEPQATANGIARFLLSHPNLDTERIIDALVHNGTEALLRTMDCADQSLQTNNRALAFEFCRLVGSAVNLLSSFVLVERGEATASAGESSGDEYVNLSDSEKETVKYFDSKIACGCLKPLLVAASTQYIGFCDRCKARAGEGCRRLLMCTGCKVAKYCSKECQRNAWDGHKAQCRRVREGKESELIS